MQLWHGAYGSEPKVISEVLTGEGTVPAFFDALAAVASTPRGGIDAKKLGSYIGMRKNRVAGGLKFVSGKVRDGYKLWAVVPS